MNHRDQVFIYGFVDILRRGNFWSLRDRIRCWAQITQTRLLITMCSKHKWIHCTNSGYSKSYPDSSACGERRVSLRWRVPVILQFCQVFFSGFLEQLLNEGPWTVRYPTEWCHKSFTGTIASTPGCDQPRRTKEKRARRKKERMMDPLPLRNRCFLFSTTDKCHFTVGYTIDLCLACFSTASSNFPTLFRFLSS